MNKPIKIKLRVSEPRRGHYHFQGCKTVFDSRPKRERTRSVKNGKAIREYD